MFADIVPHRRLPGALESFTYEVPQNLNLQPGQLVQIPFRKQKLSGIVRRLHNEKPRYPTRLIEKTIEYKEKTVTLDDKQMALAVWMTEFYKTSFAKTIDLFIPEKIWLPSTKKRKTATAKKPIKAAKTSKEKSNSAVSQIARQLLDPTGMVKKILMEKTPLPREQFYSELVKLTPQDSQILFLFPEIFHALNSAPHLPLFHGALKESEKADVWEAVRDLKINAVAGTRAALFLPFKKLHAIIVDFEPGESYDEKRAPYYNALAVAERLAEIWNVPLIAISPLPRVETYYKSLIGAYEKYEWQTARAKKTQTTIIDMANERRKGNKSLFAAETLEKISRNLSQNSQVLLFINRKGEAGALICRDCGFVFRCEKCSSPLTIHIENKLMCHRCKISRDYPVKCPSCGSVRLSPLGAGTERVEKEIKNIFSKANVLRLDSETAGTGHKSTQDLYKNARKADILIATQIIDKPMRLPRLKLSVAIIPDQLLNFPFFRAQEHALRILNGISNLTHGGEFIIQTYLPENKFFKYLEPGQLEKFYADELETRKSLSLPPFGTPPN